MKPCALWLLPLLCLLLPLRADTATSAEQYNRKAQEIINQCSRVEVEYAFIDPQIGPDFAEVGSVGLTPRNADLLANAISVGQPATNSGIDGGYLSLVFRFYNGKNLVAMAGASLSGETEAIVLLPRKQSYADYLLTAESQKMLRDWASKQPQLAKKFPH